MHRANTADNLEQFRTPSIYDQIFTPPPLPHIENSWVRHCTKTRFKPENADFRHQLLSCHIRKLDYCARHPRKSRPCLSFHPLLLAGEICKKKNSACPLKGNFRNLFEVIMPTLSPKSLDGPSLLSQRDLNMVNASWAKASSRPPKRHPPPLTQ